jgi:hypothetical protein
MVRSLKGRKVGFFRAVGAAVSLKTMDRGKTCAMSEFRGSGLHGTDQEGEQ